MKKIYIILSAILICASTYAQLDNLDFEQWEAPVEENNFSNRPTGWMWFVNNILSDQNNFIHPPDTNAQSNDYAFKLSVWYNHTKDAAIQGGPVDYRPARLKGYYKYTDNIITGPEGTVPDTAMVSVYLTTIQPWPMVIDTVGIGEVYLSYSEGYTQFEVDIEYLSDVMPQAVSIYLDPSLVKRYEDKHYSSLGEAMVSFFTVDNLSFEGEAVLSTGDINKDGNPNIYPNPAKSTLRITLDERQPISIYNTTGMLIEQHTANATHTLDVSDYPTGIYIIKSGSGVKRFVKE